MGGRGEGRWFGGEGRGGKEEGGGGCTYSPALNMESQDG